VTLPEARWMARFATERDLLDAIPIVRRAGATDVDAATPVESDAVLDSLEIRRSRIPTAAFFAAVGLGVGAWWIEWWTRNESFPSDVGARPNVSSWADLPIVFESTVLGVAVSSFVLLLVALRLPRLRHPWFAVAQFGADDACWLAWAEPHASSSRHADLAAELAALGATTILPVLPDDAEPDAVENGAGSSL